MKLLGGMGTGFLFVLLSILVPGKEVFARDPYGQINVNVSALGTFQIGIASCVAFWFDTGGTDSSIPYILTSGHCMVGIAGIRTVRDVKMPSHFWVKNNTIDFKILKIAYATVEGRDIAILPLEATYADLRRLGMTPLKLASQEALPGTKVVRVQSNKVGFACEIEAVVRVIKEGNWTWLQTYRYGCFREHGSSGAPVISSLTNEVIAVHNSGGATIGNCSEENPCEVDAFGNISFNPAAAYAQQIGGIVTCFTSQGELNVTLPSCSFNFFEACRGY